jgi:hypothetical protein
VCACVCERVRACACMYMEHTYHVLQPQPHRATLPTWPPILFGNAEASRQKRGAVSQVSETQLALVVLVVRLQPAATSMHSLQFSASAPPPQATRTSVLLSTAGLKPFLKYIVERRQNELIRPSSSNSRKQRTKYKKRKRYSQ